MISPAVSTEEPIIVPESGLLAEYARRAPSSTRMQITLTAFLGVVLVGLTMVTFLVVKRIFDRVTPSIRDDLAWKAKRGAVELAHSADLALTLGDHDMTMRVFGDYRENPDVLAIVAVSPTGGLVAKHGATGETIAQLFSGRPRSLREHDGMMISWAPSLIEDNEVGRVALVISTERLRAGQALRRDILVIAGVAGIAALLLGVFFVSFYMGPLISLLERALKGLRENTASLEERVRSRTLQLLRKKQELEESLATLSSTQRQLVEASRLTGMAEVATSVLHNVGNVLNSVNVSGQLVVDMLKRSKIDGLGKAVQLIRANATDLAAFWSGDKGQRLPAYLDALDAELTFERGRMVGELEALVKNIDHIKVIITMQQTHAKSNGGATEILALASVIDDAVGMNQISYDSHQIEVRREYEDVPKIQIDRHKLIQILMNVLSNAGQAVKHIPSGRRIVVSLRRKDAATLAITVSDNGIGIEADAMTKIFVHGFTTKKDGHGFGLHSSALAARDLRGALLCRSDGPGTGASFTLELPIPAPRQAAVEIAAKPALTRRIA